MQKEAIEKQILLILKDEVIKLRVRNADNENNIKALMRCYNKLFDSVEELKRKNGIVTEFPVSSSTTFFNPLISNEVIIKKDTKKKKVKKRFCCCF